MDLEEMDVSTSVQVACLSNVCDLERLCKKQKVRLSEKTNRFLLFLTVKKLGLAHTQNLIKKLVDQGVIEWDEDADFEVDSILDHMKDENGVDYYHIKWRGWSNSHNTWEPRHNLLCDSLVDEYHAVNKDDGGIDHSILKKRTYFQEDPVEARQQKLRDLMERIIAKSKVEVTPLTLLEIAGTKVKQTVGLTHNGPGKRTVRKTAAKGKTMSSLGLQKFASKRSKAYRQMQEETKTALKKWERTLNSLNTDPAPIFVQNDVDVEGPPDKFIYISDYKVGDGIEIPSDPLVGCECTECYESKKHCCSANAGADFAYYKHGRVRVPPGHPIYECNKRCKCGPECPNRVVQYGRKFKVAIFRTNNNRGWGVKAMQKIKRGSFVMEYIGEVITNKEAERRGKEYDTEGMTYLFDLDYTDDMDEVFTVDAGVYGNISHFVNHSCDPNMAVFGVWINHLDPRLPRIALFAKRDIKAGEELTFDYMMTGDTTHQLQTAQNLMSKLSSPSKSNSAPETMETTPASDSALPTAAPETAAAQVPTVAATYLPYTGDPNTSGLVTPSKSDAMDLDDELMGPPPPPALTAVTPTKEDGAKMHLPSTPSSHVADTDDCSSDIAPSERSEVPTASETSGSELNVDHGQDISFFRRSITSPSPAMRYRIRCQCGAANCRQYLY